MTAVRYYRMSVALPVVAPLLALVLLSISGIIFPPQYIILPHLIESVLTFLFLSLVVGGVPYIMIAVPFLFWFRNRDASWYRNFSLVAPLVFCVLLIGMFLGWGLVEMLLDQTGSINLVEVFRTFGLSSLILGYVYVLLVHIGFFVLLRLGYIDSASHS